MKSLKNILAVSLIYLAGCSHGPEFKESPCILDPDFDKCYYTPSNGQTIEIKIDTMSGYACFSLEDTQTLVNWIKNHSRSAVPVSYKKKILNELEKLVWAQENVNVFRSN